MLDTDHLVNHPWPVVSSGGTHYERLGVTVDASTDEIHDAYRTLARRVHPDRSTRQADTDDMAALNHAWFVLRDHDRRAAYDRTLGDLHTLASITPPADPQGADATSPSTTDTFQTRAFRRLVVTATVVFGIAAVTLTIIAIIGAGNRP